MSPALDITATILFHAEGAFAAPALDSLAELVRTARDAGLTVEARAVLDTPDGLTRQIVRTRGVWLDGMTEVAFGDPGLARNVGTQVARGEFLAFLDGDDLWGADWLRLAHAAATAADAPVGAIWHPEVIYTFDEEDIERPGERNMPNFDARSVFMRQNVVSGVDFDRDLLLVECLWSANAFAPRELHRRFPYRGADRTRGLSYEDWSWNIETVWAGIPHLMVPDTVHLVRLKSVGSENQRNESEGMLPHLPSYIRPRLGRRG